MSVPNNSTSLVILPFFPGQIEQSVIAVKEVARASIVLDDYSSSGLDGVHPVLLKSCYLELA